MKRNNVHDIAKSFITKAIDNLYPEVLEDIVHNEWEKDPDYWSERIGLHLEAENVPSDDIDTLLPKYTLLACILEERAVKRVQGCLEIMEVAWKGHSCIDGIVKRMAD